MIMTNFPTATRCGHAPKKIFIPGDFFKTVALNFDSKDT